MKKNDLKIFSKNLGINENILDLIILKNLKITKKELFFLDEIDNSFLKNIENDLERLKNWEPIEYILQKANFFSLDFYVDSRVLIPRNDTEVMVFQVLEIKNLEKYFFIDIWTWSSAIISSVFMNSKIKNWLAIDISKDALEVAKKNIFNFWLENRIKILENNLLENIKIFEEKNIIITANLPYIKNWDFKNMSSETVKFEPNLALFWWENTGFELYEKLIWQCLELKKNLEEIILFIEIWFDQSEFAKNFLKNLDLKFEVFKDNSEIDRCIKIYF